MNIWNQLLIILKNIMRQLGFSPKLTSLFKKDGEVSFFNVKGFEIKYDTLDEKTFNRYVSNYIKKMKLSNFNIINNKKYYSTKSVYNRKLDSISGIKIIFTDFDDDTSTIVQDANFFAHYIIHKNGIVECINALTTYTDIKNFDKVIIYLADENHSVWHRRQKNSVIKLMSLLALTLKLNPYKSISIDNQRPYADEYSLSMSLGNKVHAILKSLRECRGKYPGRFNKQYKNAILRFKSSFVNEILEEYNG